MATYVGFAPADWTGESPQAFAARGVRSDDAALKKAQKVADKWGKPIRVKERHSSGDREVGTVYPRTGNPGVARIISREPIRRRNARPDLVELINIYNEASDPAAYRTDEEHEVERERARTALRAIRQYYVEDVDYKEFSNGMLWPISR